MKVLLDTCVMMDFLQKREPFAQSARTIMQLAAMKFFSGFITATSVTDIYYLTHKCTHNDKESQRMLSQLFSIIGLLDTTSVVIIDALHSKISDFEDAVMVETAKATHMDCIITRNKKDFDKSTIAVYTPEEFIEIMEVIEDR